MLARDEDPASRAPPPGSGRAMKATRHAPGSASGPAAPETAAGPGAGRLLLRRLGLPLLVVVAVALVFRPALSAGFVDWDDDAGLRFNRAFRGFSLEHLSWMAT